MSQTADVLEQFIVEARECLEAIGQRLLDIEKAPQDLELLNDLFRSVHTLKGNCGMFEFGPLERVVHAGEDVLDQVRSGRLAYSSALADVLLAAMDLSAEMIDTIASTGTLPDADGGRSVALAQQLRSFLGGAAVAAPASSPTTSPATTPDWAAALPADWQRPGHQVLRYQPEPECFFKGEDPWALVQQTPGLLALRLCPPGDWGPLENFDCYRCQLGFELLSDADGATLQQHFRYVPEQCEFHVWAAADEPAPATGSQAGADTTAADALPAPPARVVERAQQLWRDQLSLLDRTGTQPGTVAAVAQVLGHLLPVLATPAQREALAKLPPPWDSADALAAWAQRALGSQAIDETARKPAGRTAESDDAPTHERGTARVLKVAQDKIDRLMDLIGEMVVAKNALPYLAQRAETQFGQRELAREIKNQYAVINRIAEDMQHAIMQVRMLPVGTVFQRFGRLVRDISKRLGKEVELVVEGDSTEADKNVIESLADPLIHILRNSLDHGIELPAQRLAAGKPAHGTLRVSARQEGDRVMLDISDDGAGIDTARVRAKAVERGLIPAERADQLSDAEAVQLVFLPGFSTADNISDLSGRGVGMDVVRSAVERINGSVALSSQRGQGTQIRLALPLSMAVTHVMMIRAGGCRFGVPMDLIVETVRVPAEDIHRFKTAQTVVLRGRVVPLQSLNQLLCLEAPPALNTDGEHAVLVLRWGHEQIGLIVDEFEGTSDIILRPLEGVLSGMTGFAGSALMGDGSVLMVLNPKELI
jgi:two-component system chemotaxis sensor kinase CheA